MGKWLNCLHSRQKKGKESFITWRRNDILKRKWMSKYFWPPSFPFPIVFSLSIPPVLIRRHRPANFRKVFFAPSSRLSLKTTRRKKKPLFCYFLSRCPKVRMHTHICRIKSGKKLAFNTHTHFAFPENTFKSGSDKRQ